jgi:hypothetical protein
MPAKFPLGDWTLGKAVATPKSAAQITSSFMIKLKIRLNYK